VDRITILRRFPGRRRFGRDFINGLQSIRRWHCLHDNGSPTSEWNSTISRKGRLQPNLAWSKRSTQSGTDVAFDPVNKLVSGRSVGIRHGRGAAAFHVYNIKGNLVESLDGFNFFDMAAVIRTTSRSTRAIELG